MKKKDKTVKLKAALKMASKSWKKVKTAKKGGADEYTDPETDEEPDEESTEEPDEESSIAPTPAKVADKTGGKKKKGGKKNRTKKQRKSRSMKKGGDPEVLDTKTNMSPAPAM